MTEHLHFVYVSYGLAALILGGLIAWLWWERNATVDQLRKLEDNGMRRRSDDGADDE